MRRTNSSVAAIVVLIVSAATILCAYWAVRVPFFSEPDELAHADYAFALSDAGRPFLVRGGVPQRTVTPEERYLVRAVRYRENRYTAWFSYPPDFGTAPYYGQVDREAPGSRWHVPASGEGAPLPYVMYLYPVGYYAVAAAFMRIVAIVDPASVTARMFAARFVGVICLPIVLGLGYRSFRLLRLERGTAALATASIGFLPVVTWVFGYVQPDVLTTALFTAAVYGSLRWRSRPSATAGPLVLGISLLALAFVKQHYFATAWLATFLAAIAMPAARHRIAQIACAFVPPLLGLTVALTLSPTGRIGAPKFSPDPSAATIAPLARVATDARLAARALTDAFGGGSPFRDFWYSIGLHGGSIFTPDVSAIVAIVVRAATLTIVWLFLARSLVVGWRLVRVARERSAVLALRLVGGDVIVNAYVLTTFVLVAVFVASGGTVWLEGRYWLPVIVPLLGIVLARTPQLAKSAARRKTSFVFAGAWAAYGCIAACCGFSAVDTAFYRSPAAPIASEPYSDVSNVTSTDGCAMENDPADFTVRRGCVLHVRGFAVDGGVGEPARSVFVTLDGMRYARARTGTASKGVADRFNDDDLAHCGFVADVDTRSLSSGTHSMRLEIVEARAPRGLASAWSATLRVGG